MGKKAKRAKRKKKNTAEIEIKCAFRKMVPVGELKPNPRNPNLHPERQITVLAYLIAEDGFRHAIVVSNQSGFIVSGHGRLLAAKKIGMPVVPVDFQDYDSTERETAILMSDNIIAELAEFDVPMAGQLLSELKAADYDLGLTALDEDEIKRILDSIEIDDHSPEPASSIGLHGIQFWFTDDQLRAVNAAIQIRIDNGIETTDENPDVRSLALHDLLTTG